MKGGEKAMRYLMLRDVPEYLWEQRGFRISHSTLQKLSAPGCSQGPPVAGHWGRRVLFDPAEVLRWFDGRLQPARPSEAA
jgi:hypothetical protein